MTEDQTRRDYQREYYLQRKEKLSRRRKDRYRSDPEYREKAKAAARQYREERRRQVAHLREIGELPPPIRQRGPRKPVDVEVRGEMVKAYTISTLASRINRSSSAINFWTRAGLLPKTPLRSARGERLYTDGMIEVVKTALDKRSAVREKDKSFAREIRQGWRDLGIAVQKS